MNDPRLVRVSDAERHAVIERLQSATAEGRLTLDELDDRVTGTLVARTRIDLDELVDDLPDEVADEPAPEPDEPAPSTKGAPLGVLALGAAAIPAAYLSGWGFLLSLLTVVCGATLLVTRREMSRANRFALVAGVTLALVPPAFAVTVFLLLMA